MNTYKRKQIILDTETTGINVIGIPYYGHKIIEIGAITLYNRKFTGEFFHVYLNPNRLIDHSAFLVHGIKDSYLTDKPEFSDIAKKFLNYIYGNELIIHNANFDISFIDYELQMLNMNFPKIKDICTIIDTLDISRKIFPGKKNNLNALCSRYKISIDRTNHSAILDAKILSKIYLLMTSDQKIIDFHKNEKNNNKNQCIDYKSNYYKFIIIFPNNLEIQEHKRYLKYMKDKFGKCIWKDMYN